LSLPLRSSGALQSAPQAAAQVLREAIIAGELKGGDRILEQKWSERLGIGQPTLREAMRELEHQGLLRRTTQRGTFVAVLSPDDYRQILEVRIPLEAMAVSRAAKRITPELEAELSSIVEAMAGIEHDSDVKRFHDCDVMFHRTIWKAADNRYLEELLETITFRLFVFSIVGRWPESPGFEPERHASIEQHQGILDGIRTGDPERARMAFIQSTVVYWNKQYGLLLDESDLMRGFLSMDG
jgi:DNA-binding GntR family transcriptional regulator